MIKGKIAGVKNFKDSIYIRIKVDNKTKKRYTQFRQNLSDKIPNTKYGIKEFTKLTGKDVDVNVFREDQYWHIVMYGKKRRDVLAMLQENFELIEPVSK